MKKPFLLLFLCLIITIKSFCQFSGVLAGYPLVTAGWNYGGDATVVDSTIQLTPPTTNQGGYVYYNTVVDLTTCAQFSVKFDFKIVPDGFTTVADGIAFWYISNPPSGFVLGGGIGLPSNPDGLVLILDTYDNDGNGNNPLETLLGYTGSTLQYVEGSPTGVLAPVIPNQNFIDDGNWHHCELDYNAGNISVYFNYNPVASITAYYPMSIAGYFGFSASTGSLYSTQSVKDVYISAAGIALTPAVTSPVTYCQYATAAPLSATGTGPFHWYTTDTATVVSLPGTPTPVTSVLGTTTYYVRQGTGTCISPADSIKVIVNPAPPAPVITGDTSYCTGATSIPLTATGSGTIKWYIVPTGGASTTIAPSVSTAVAGKHAYYASETINGCEGPRDSIHVAVYTTPPPPVLGSGGLVYCQYATVIPLVEAGTGVLWYSSLTGGTGSPAAPIISTAAAGTFVNYASQTDSGCTSARATISVTVHPKPSPPVINPPHTWCQFMTPGPVSASPSSTGDNLLWYGPGIVAGTSSAPTPSTSAAPDTIHYYVTETSSYGCVSDSAQDQVVIIKKPAPPAVSNISYCQQDNPTALNAQVDSAANSELKWYMGGSFIGTTAVPPTDTTPGNMTWYVSQTVNTCESDSAAVTVTLLYKPVFGVTSSQPWVCRFDSITLKYTGPQLTAPAYTWTLPEGAYFANGTHVYDDSVIVKFDSAVVNNYVQLTVSDDSGRCKSDTSVRIKIVSQPSALATTIPDVCLGDTVDLALGAIINDATTYTWNIDYVTLTGSPAINIVRDNSNSGGPFSIQWIDSGRHVIEVQSFTEEGCMSEPAFDTVNVHTIPDAHFKITSDNTGGCIGDSVQFTADAADYNNLYQWSPSQSFENINQPVAWGQVEQPNTVITLKVTDPFGCAATENMEIDPGSCCTVALPTAFTPNGDSHNDYFRPLYNGYHHFHVFRILNRWGQVVFNSENSGMQWDGNFNGVPQDMGTYYFYLKYDCGGKTLEQKGDLTLIR